MRSSLSSTSTSTSKAKARTKTRAAPIPAARRSGARAPRGPRLFPVIMAGGSGTRFWPLSRAALPKQFLPLVGQEPLIVEALRRLEGLAAIEDARVVCGRAHARLVQRALPELPASSVLVEPQARNTAPAIALATASVQAVDPEGVLVVLPSDQHVAKAGPFQAAVRRAARLAARGFIVTLGIRPTRPETGYGYIRVGEALGADGCRVAAFVEKPDRTTAERYRSSGDYLWNAGIFVFRADVMRAAFEAHMPELAAALSPIAAAFGSGRARAIVAREFPRMPATSIDYGVAEKAQNVAVVPVDCGWSDVGSFEALTEVRPRDPLGNVVLGESALLLEASGCVVHAGERLVAVVGMKDTVVVDGGDCVLVLPRERSQDVRKVIEALKGRGLAAYL